ncbi:unnamed protein product [Pleuronectes platessa]|uniref:Uncharacterized protein n=1 Tax=Pleuronectes platessa TaxID=8262 RepID=A0A9N7V4S3_PLEPL|nr:unnamed protein product [Pleuronectes platessa]
MYRSGKPEDGPPPFRAPSAHGPPFTFGGSCRVPPRGHLAPGPHGSFSASASDRQFLHNRPPREHFIRPHCSNFPIDRSTAIASGGSQKMAPHAEPPHLQVLQWIPTPAKHHLPDSDRAGEEFLRCIAANKPLPDYLKGDMAYNLAEAFKSANVLKDAVKSDPEFNKHGSRSISQSRSRSRGKSRGKSRCRSRGKSCGKSRAKSRARSRSRVRSRSRGRSKSHARGKSRARNKSRGRSKSRSRSQSKQKSHVRSKSRTRRSKSRSGSMEKRLANDKRKRSPSPSCSSSVENSNNLTGKCLLEGLKLVMNSKELEERLPTLKDAILTIQASDESKKVQCIPKEQHNSQDNSTSMENDSMVLPHDRTGEHSSDVSALSSQQSIFSGFGDLIDLKQPLQMTSSINLDSSEFEKIKNILKSQGTPNINQIVVKMQGQKEEKHLSPALLGSDPTAASLTMQAMKNSNVQQALQSLQSLIKATKEKRAKSDGSGTSQTSDKHKASNGEEIKRERQARKKSNGILDKRNGGIVETGWPEFSDTSDWVLLPEM